MPDKKRRLESTLAAVQLRHGPQALRRGEDTSSTVVVPHIPTGFTALDALTGCGGIPLGALTLLGGRTTSGKLTVAYKMLARAQRDAHGQVAYPVALLDLSRSADPDYVFRCGVDLDALLVGRPPAGPQAVHLLGDLLAAYGARAVVIDSLPDLVANGGLPALNAALGQLQQRLRAARSALLVLDEPQPPWLHWLGLNAGAAVRRAAVLHIEMQRERWLRQNGVLSGYRAQARLLKSRWTQPGGGAGVEIIFNGVVKARETW